MNYEELKTAIRDYLQVQSETYFEQQIDQFIRNAEKRIYQAVRLPVRSKVGSLTMTATNAFLGAPADFLSPDFLSVTSSGVRSQLLLKDTTFILEAYPDPTATGLPKHYSIYNDSDFLLGPTPDSNYSVSLGYQYHPESIVTANTTWLGDNAEDTLLYGCLVDGAVFIKSSSDRLQQYKSLYDESLIRLKVLAEGADMQDIYRENENKLKVT